MVERTAHNGFVVGSNPTKLIAHLVKMVDTSDLKFDSDLSIGSSPIVSKPKWWKLVYTLGLGSSSFKV